MRLIKIAILSMDLKLRKRFIATKNALFSFYN